MEQETATDRAYPAAYPALAAAAAVGLYLVSRVNYTLFHALAEMVSIVVALSVFTLAWTSRRFLRNGYLLFVATACLFVGFLDLLHVLAYKGMAVFARQTWQANQLWIAARYMESLSLLAGFAFLSARRRPNPALLLVAFGIVTSLVVGSIFHWRNFPVCYTEEGGQTPFKIWSEFVIVAVLGAGLLLLRRNRASFAPRVYGTVAASILLAVACEFSFTLYFDVFGVWNLLGHYFKIASFVAVYLALVHTGIVDPYRTVFRELTETNRRLTEEVEAHTRTGEAKDAAIAKLTAANEEINVLRGIIPLCAHCGKIRDDRGAWSRIEAYLREHSGTRFSHGICPDCLRKNYPTGGREPGEGGGFLPQ